MVGITHIFQCYLSGIGSIIQLSQCQKSWKATFKDICEYKITDDITKTKQTKMRTCFMGYTVHVIDPLLLAGDWSWWRHQMETSSALLALCAGHSPVTCEFPSQRPATRSFDIFFDLHPNQQVSKQWRRRWSETPSCSFWRHCNGISVTYLVIWFQGNNVRTRYLTLIYLYSAIAGRHTVACIQWTKYIVLPNECPTPYVSTRLVSHSICALPIASKLLRQNNIRSTLANTFQWIRQSILKHRLRNSGHFVRT